jgi:hypothetical protein
MNAESSSEAALHEYVDAEWELPDSAAPAREQALRAVLENVPGVADFHMEGTILRVHYEPVCVSKAELEKRVQDAGFRLTTRDVAAASPVVDAISPG